MAIGETIEALLEQQSAALDAGDVAAARILLGKIKEMCDKEDTRHWLRYNQPESYDQLISKLRNAESTLSEGGHKNEMAHLIDVFEECEKCGISLEELDVKKNLPKYREALRPLREITQKKELDESDVTNLKKMIDRIKEYPNRDATRAKERVPISNPTGWHRVVLEDETEALVIHSSRETIERIVAGMRRSVDKDLLLDDALLSELRRALQTDE